MFSIFSILEGSGLSSSDVHEERKLTVPNHSPIRSDHFIKEKDEINDGVDQVPEGIRFTSKGSGRYGFVWITKEQSVDELIKCNENCYHVSEKKLEDRHEKILLIA